MEGSPPGNEPELDAVRRSLRSGRPFGAADWTEGMAERLGIELNLRPRGRPRKEKRTDTNDRPRPRGRPPPVPRAVRPRKNELTPISVPISVRHQFLSQGKMN